MSNVPNAEPDPILLARHLYESLASGDAGSVHALLHPSFTGRTTAGLPLGLGGDYDSPEAMTEDFWWAIGRHYRARAEPGSNHSGYLPRFFLRGVPFANAVAYV